MAREDFLQQFMRPDTGKKDLWAASRRNVLVKARA